MSKNNYFNYNHNSAYLGFVNYILAFAMEEYKDEDPLLSECAKELICYFLQMEQDKNMVVTSLNANTSRDIEVFVVNYIQSIKLMIPQTTVLGCQICNLHNGESYRIKLSINKLKEICEKYQSKNPFFIHFLQFLDEQEQILTQ